MKSKTINYEIPSYFTCIITYHIFAARKENKIPYISISKITIYLFRHFYFFCFISKEFADFAFLKMQMQITFAKSFKVLNNAICSVLKGKLQKNGRKKFKKMRK